MANPSGTYGVSPSVVDLVGNTPLIRLRQIERDLDGVELYAKAEWKNPGGSVKDRPALRMIQEGLAAGKLTPGKTILDATSGNTGIAYAMIGAAMDVWNLDKLSPQPHRPDVLRSDDGAARVTSTFDATGALVERVTVDRDICYRNGSYDAVLAVTDPQVAVEIKASAGHSLDDLADEFPFPPDY